MARTSIILNVSANKTAGSTPWHDFDHLEDSVFAPDSCRVWCADTACDGTNCSSTFYPNDFHEATTFFMQQLQPLVANAKLDLPLDSHPPLSRELMLTRLETDDWDTTDSTQNEPEDHGYTEHYDDSYDHDYQEHQQHHEYDTEQYYQGTGPEEHRYTEESNEQEHIQEGVT